MSANRPRLAKPTLDKDLAKISTIEEASRYLTRGFAIHGAALIFLVLMAAMAGSFATGRSDVILVVCAAAIAGYMAMNIGANDVTNNIGAAVGARAMTMGFGLALAAVFEIAGAVIGGGHVANTIANGIMREGVITGPDVLIWAMMAALLSAALFINIATWLGWPISTTHSIVGSVMGSGIAAAGISAIDWTTVGGITLSWMISPLLGAVFAAAFLYFIKQTIIYRSDKIAGAKRWVPVLIGIMTGTFAGYLALVGLGQLIEVSTLNATLVTVGTGLISWRLLIPVIARQAEGLENRNQSLRKLFRIPLVFAAALMSFAHGANDVSNAIGPLAAIVSASRHGVIGQVQVPMWALVIGGLGISLGLVLYGPKLVKLVGSEITKLNPMRAYCVSLSTAMTVMTAAWIGVPVSSTHIAVGAVFGVGFFREWYTRHSRRRYEYLRVRAGEEPDAAEPIERNDDEFRHRYLVRRSHFLSIIAAWTITLPCAAALSVVMSLIMFAIFL
ncbi:inorganic phosphate transporter [Rhizobiales bacterium RZME27]|uniref:Phosphate transporter n=1 Tax=Endobacterium cereale TaxID=2663029 RepID=A0A6A8AG20_9HYPH|nr:inorganic phosphate transporter [Endobacterium cereale]MEB2846837.1 anion permease [Endobacterium cereale]MQY47741.1 inorganic phosphate transporter [Endobacterium cereale]